MSTGNSPPRRAALLTTAPAPAATAKKKKKKHTTPHTTKRIHKDTTATEEDHKHQQRNKQHRAGAAGETIPTTTQDNNNKILQSTTTTQQQQRQQPHSADTEPKHPATNAAATATTTTSSVKPSSPSSHHHNTQQHASAADTAHHHHRNAAARREHVEALKELTKTRAQLKEALVVRRNQAIQLQLSEAHVHQLQDALLDATNNIGTGTNGVLAAQAAAHNASATISATQGSSVLIERARRASHAAARAVAPAPHHAKNSSNTIFEHDQSAQREIAAAAAAHDHPRSDKHAAAAAGTGAALSEAFFFKQQEKRHQLESDFQSAQGEIAALQDEVAELKAAEARHMDEKDEHLKQFSDLTKHCESLNNVSRGYQRELEKVRDMLAGRVRENNTLVAHSKQIAARVKSLEEEAALWSKLQESKDTSDREVTRLQTQLLKMSRSAGQKHNQLQNELIETRHYLEEMKADYESFAEVSKLEHDMYVTKTSTELEHVRKEYSDYKTRVVADAKWRYHENQSIIDALQAQFAQYRRAAETLFFEEAQRLEHKLLVQMQKYEEEIRYVVKVKDTHFQNMVMSKDAKIMNLVEGTDFEKVIVRHQMELDRLSKQHERDIQLVTEQTKAEQRSLIAELRQDLSSRAAEIDRYHTQILSWEAKLEETMAMMRRERKNHAANEAGMEKYAKELQQELHLAVRQVEALTQVKENLRHRLLRMRLRLAGQTDESVESIVIRLTKEGKRVEHDVSELSEKYKEKLAENAKLRARDVKVHRVIARLERDLKDRTREYAAVVAAMEKLYRTRVTRVFGNDGGNFRTIGDTFTAPGVVRDGVSAVLTEVEHALVTSGDTQQEHQRGGRTGERTRDPRTRLHALIHSAPATKKVSVHAGHSGRKGDVPGGKDEMRRHLAESLAIPTVATTTMLQGTSGRVPVKGAVNTLRVRTPKSVKKLFKGKRTSKVTNQQRTDANNVDDGDGLQISLGDDIDTDAYLVDALKQLQRFKALSKKFDESVKGARWRAQLVRNSKRDEYGSARRHGGGQEDNHTAISGNSVVVDSSIGDSGQLRMFQDGQTSSAGVVRLYGVDDAADKAPDGSPFDVVRVRRARRTDSPVHVLALEMEQTCESDRVKTVGDVIQVHAAGASGRVGEAALREQNATALTNASGGQAGASTAAIPVKKPKLVGDKAAKLKSKAKLKKRRARGTKKQKPVAVSAVSENSGASVTEWQGKAERAVSAGPIHVEDTVADAMTSVPSAVEEAKSPVGVAVAGYAGDGDDLMATKERAVAEVMPQPQ